MSDALRNKNPAVAIASVAAAVSCGRNAKESSNATPAEAEHEQRPPPNDIDERDRRYRAAKSDSADDQPVHQRLLHTKMIDGAEQRRHPSGDAIGYEICANPNEPHRYGTTQINALEQ